MFKLEEGWLTVVLLVVMITVATWGFAAASWVEGLWAAWFTAILGVLAGLVLSRSRFSGLQATFFGAVYGLFAVGFFLGVTLNGTWHERSLELVYRLNLFLYKALYGGTSRDLLPFAFFIAFLFWAFGVLAAWAVFRRGAVWPAVIPSGLALLINAYYYFGPSRVDLYLALYVLLALLLVARVSLLGREREWRSARVNYNPDARLDFLRAGLALALAGVVVGWAGPSLAASPQAATAWQQATRPWSSVRELWMRLFASIRAYGQNVNDFYGDSLALGGPAILGDDPIMDVLPQVIVDENAPDSFGLPSVPRYWWRAAAYGTYAQGRWQAGEVEFEEVDPLDPPLRLPNYRQREDVSLTFTMHAGATSRLYVAPQPRWLDRYATFEVTFDPLQTVDISAVRAQQIVQRGEVYRLVASMSSANVQSLREDDTNYPKWVTDNFLQLPAEITDRTRALARQIVAEAGAENPFDQAQAITDWLRTNIAYDQFISAPPQGVEPVDYLLFESRRGYCNYYASAEVILLRSLGIPARLAVGFAQGALDEETGTYRVVEKNAHAWPEVFFPHYGWVEFEPTVSEAPLVRPERVDPASGASSVIPPPLSERPNEAEERPPERDTPAPAAPMTLERVMAALRAAGLALGVLLAGAAVITLVATVAMLRIGLTGWESLGQLGRWVLRSRGLSIPSAVSAAYLHLERAARWLGLSLPEAFTPHERAAALSASLPEARPGIAVITEQYVTERYGARLGDGPAAQAAWRSMRTRVWRQGLRTLLRRWTEGGRPTPGARE